MERLNSAGYIVHKGQNIYQVLSHKTSWRQEVLMYTLDGYILVSCWLLIMSLWLAGSWWALHWESKLIVCETDIDLIMFTDPANKVKMVSSPTPYMKTWEFGVGIMLNFISVSHVNVWLTNSYFGSVSNTCHCCDKITVQRFPLCCRFMIVFFLADVGGICSATSMDRYVQYSHVMASN